MTIYQAGTEHIVYSNNITDEDRKFILAQAKAKILSYCHRTNIPQDAYYIWADMAICEYKLLDPSLFADVIDSDLAKKLNQIKQPLLSELSSSFFGKAPILTISLLLQKTLIVFF